MVEIKYCPSTLAEGYNTYSPQAVKRLFDGKKVSPFLDFNINELKQSDVIVQAMQRISVSGVQEKFTQMVDGKPVESKIPKDIIIEIYKVVGNYRRQ